MECGEVCNTYRILLLQSGRTLCPHKWSAVAAGSGTAAVSAPDGLGFARSSAGGKMICFKIDRFAVDDVLSDGLGRQVTSQLDVAFILPVTSAPTQS
jgi:hypothetical protein